MMGQRYDKQEGFLLQGVMSQGDFVCVLACSKPSKCPSLSLTVCLSVTADPAYIRCVNQCSQLITVLKTLLMSDWLAVCSKQSAYYMITICAIATSCCTCNFIKCCISADIKEQKSNKYKHKHFTLAQTSICQCLWCCPHGKFTEYIWWIKHKRQGAATNLKTKSNSLTHTST